MNLSAERRTWEEASSPAAVRLSRKYEEAWHDGVGSQHRVDLDGFLREAALESDGAGARLAVLRTDMSLRWECSDKVGADWYVDRYPDLGEDTIVALIYEEFCLREEDQQGPSPDEFVARFPQVAEPLSRVLEIHKLVGSATASVSLASAVPGAAHDGAFPEVGQTIGDFVLVEELGRGSFARVFLAREPELADRPVALKVARRGSREPQTLARLQHTHIVPVHSNSFDQATGLHLLCMPYFGRITLARILTDPDVQATDSGATLVEALDRLDPTERPSMAQSAGRSALLKRSYPRAIAWWGARLAEALEHAHDRGVLHRDIKPSNVLVTSDGMPMLLDFNLAREPVLDQAGPGSATLGGTIDFMAPEHLRALAEGSPESVDGRADIYGLGVVLYEAVTGERPFGSPRKGVGVVEALVWAALDRERPIKGLRETHPEVPPAFEAVIKRCLEPSPDERYETAGQLAADLQAVADDQALPHAREPLASRAAGWLRRRRRRLAVGAGVLAAAATLAVFALGLLLERSRNYRLIDDEIERGGSAMKNEEYAAAKMHFDTAANLAGRFRLRVRNPLAKLRDIRGLGEIVALKLADLRAGFDDLGDLRQQALERAAAAERHRSIRQDADDLFATADNLRFRILLNEGDGLARISEDLKKPLEPFYVFESENWTALEPMMTLLDRKRREQLKSEVNELLFLWTWAIESSLAPDPDEVDRTPAAADLEVRERALAICRQALSWAEPKEPWRALEERLLKAEAAAPAGPAGAGRGDAHSLNYEPAQPALEPSAVAAFQWGLLNVSDKRMPRAVDWLRRAVRLKSDRYWYEFLLGYLEDRSGHVELAIDHYSVAAALEPDSPWVRFSRARLYRSKGYWDIALDDMEIALRSFAGRPEACKVGLEMGYLHQELGDFRLARAQYDAVIRADSTGLYAPAARLNRANIDAESGAVDRASAEYDDLLALDWRDTAARQSRALLELRLGKPERAVADATALVNLGPKVKNRNEALAIRAVALLLLGRSREAVGDALEAQRLRPSPAHERLLQRALLAARQTEQLQLDRPEDLALFPVPGRRLERDLRAMVGELNRFARAQPGEALKAALNQAVMLAALNEPAAARAEAARALALSPGSPRAYLISARVKAHGGDRRAAREDVERGLAIQFDEPGLLELRGVLSAAEGDNEAALADFDQAIYRHAVGHAHRHRASALLAIGRIVEAANDWSRALIHDPEVPEAYLGRARAEMMLGQWQLAISDLELAASWAHADPRIELEITLAYFNCLRYHPTSTRRWLALAKRTAGDLWRSLVAGPSAPAVAEPRVAGAP
jgi:serine/threonine protein kinase/lipoprotein NlpI